MNAAKLLSFSSGLPSELRDPFQKESMTTFRTNCYIGYGGAWVYRGCIEFKNGKTDGTQNFEADSFEVLCLKMADFVRELK